MGNTTVYISGIRVEYLSCTDPTSVAVDASTVTATGFKVTWDGEQNVGDTYKVRLTSGGNPVYSADNISSKYFIFNQSHGVDTATSYVVYVSKNCSGLVETDEASSSTIRTDYAIYSAVNDNNRGTVVGKTVAPYGSSVTLTAVNYPGFQFDRWEVYNTSSVLQGTLNNKEITVTLNDDNRKYTYKAVFSPIMYTVTVTAGDGGSLHAGSATTGSYAYGTLLTLKAEADEANHYHFVRWNDGNEMPERTVMVSGTAAYNAIFARDSYTVSASVDNGSAELAPAGGNYEYGTTVTITATPTANYEILGWTKNGADYPTVNMSQVTYTVTDAAAFRVLTAKEQHTLNVVSANPDKGYITGDANGSYDYDQTVSVTAVPAASYYEFDHWDDNPALTNPTLSGLSMSADQTHTAHFRVKSYPVDIAAGANGTLTYTIGGVSTVGTVSGIYEHGTQIVLQAKATTGYEFSKWNDNQTNATRTIVVGGTVDLTANFVQSKYTLALSANDDAKGTTEITAGVKPTGYSYGDNVTIRAVVGDANLYKFLSWSDGNTASERTVTMTGNAEYMALFGSLDKLTVSVLSNNSAWGTAGSSKSSVDLNEEVAVNATPAAHCHLVGWSDMPGNTDLTRTGVHITNDTIITAIFAPDTHTVTVVNSEYGSSVSGGGEYLYGATATLYAEPAANCHFTGWTGSVTSTDNPLTVTVDGDKSYTAGFARNTVHIEASAANGAVSTADTTVYYDSIFTLTATGAAHYSHFKGWTRNGVAIVGGETITVDATADGYYQAVYAIDTVTLTVDVNDATMGSVNGPASGKYVYGTAITLSAVPANHYDFTGWTGSNTGTGDISVTLTDDYSVTATFAIQTRTLSVGIETGDEVMGSVSAVSGSYSYGVEVEVTATPNAGVRFVQWSDGNTMASRTVVMTGDKDIKADFDLISYNVVIATNNSTMGMVSGTKAVYHYGDELHLTATPNTGVHFIRWSNGATVNPLDTVVYSDINLTALFDNDTFTVTVVNSEYGSSVSGGGEYLYGATATLYAEPAANCHFTGWTGSVTSTDNPLTVTVDGDKSYTAGFARNTVHIEASAANGAVSTADTTVYYDSIFTLTATGAAHYSHFKGWTRNGVAIVGGETITVDATADGYYQAVYAIDTVTLTVDVNDATMGSVNGPASGKYVYGTAITLSAVPANHYDFTGWTGSNTGTGDISVTLTDDYSVTATFAIQTRTLSVGIETGDEVMGSVSAVSGSYSYGVEVEVTATPNAGVRFVQWSDGNTMASRTVVMTGDKDIKADFDLISYNVVIATNNSTMGMVSGTKTVYRYGDELHLTATPNNPVTGEVIYKFISWSDGTTTATLDTIVYGDINLTAVFAYADLKNVTVKSNNSAVGSVSADASSVVKGGTVDIHASVIDEHYEFTGWSDGNADSNRTITVMSDTTLTAIFMPKSYTVNITAGEHGSVSGDVAGTAVYGSTVTFKAEADGHYHFVKWVEDDNINAERTVLVDGDVSYTAVFALNEYTVAIASNDDVMGGVIVTPAGPYHYGDTVRAVASVNDANLYKFIGWNDGTATATLDTVVHSDINLTAIFGDANKYTVYVSANNAEMGSVTGSGNYFLNENVTVTATAAAHHHFVGWVDVANNVVATTESFVIDVESDTTLMAVFSINSHKVTLTNTLSGEVDETYYSYGANANIVAGDSTGYHFMRFENAAGDILSESNPMVLSLVNDTVVYIIYAIDTFDVTLVYENGTIVTSKVRYTYGEGARFVAEPSDRYHFVGWEIDGDALNFVGDTLDTAIYSNHTVEAFFDKDQVTFTLGNNINDAISQASYSWGTTIDVEAMSYDNYHFKGFYDEDGNLLGSVTPMSMTIDSNTIIYAWYAIDTFDVTLVAENGTIHTDALRYTYGDTAVFTHEAAANYYFAGWMVDGVATGNDDTLRVEVDSNITVTALFTIDNYSFAVSSSNMAMGYVTGTANGTYSNGTAVEVMAHANPHYVFVGWVSGGDTIATDNTLGFTLTADTAIVALFDDEYYTVAVDANDTAMGSVAGAGEYTYHSLATLTATAAEGHHFVDWSDGVTTVTRMLYVEGDTNVTANFGVDTHYVTVNVNDANMGSVSGEGWYNWGDTVTVRATANEHFKFIGFDGRADHIDSISFVVTADTTITAFFDYKYMRLYSRFEHGSVEITVDDVQADVSTMPVMAQYGDSIVMTATPDTYYHFVNWVEYSVTFDTTTVYDTTYVTDSHATVDPVTGEPITVTDTLSITIDTTVVYIPTYTQIATYDDVELGFRIYSDRYIDAIFEVNQVSLQLNGTHVTVTGAGIYNAGDTVTVTASADEHYVFVGWSNTAEGSVIVDNNASYTFVIEDDMTLWAVTEGEALTVTLVASPAAGGTMTGAGTYHYGDVVNVSATANEGYTFMYWVREDGSNVTESAFSFTIVSNVTLIAKFHNVGISDVDMTDVKVYANGNVIYVNGVEKQTVRIFDAVGRMVESKVADGENIQFRMDASGIYMVQVGNSRAQRVMVVR